MTIAEVARAVASWETKTGAMPQSLLVSRASRMDLVREVRRTARAFNAVPPDFDGDDDDEPALSLPIYVCGVPLWAAHDVPDDTIHAWDVPDAVVPR